LSMTGCGSKSSNTLTVGDIVPLTGDLAPFGPPGEKAARLAVEQANAALKQDGIKLTVKLDNADEQTNSAASVSAARKLISGESPDWSAPMRERFFDSLAYDFNTPRALAEVFDWVREANASASPVGEADLREMLGVLGLENLLEPDVGQAPPAALELVEARERARAARDYAESDRLRNELREIGWEVRDSPGGPELLPVK